jgi:hypothetical protein
MIKRTKTNSMAIRFIKKKFIHSFYLSIVLIFHVWLLGCNNQEVAQRQRIIVSTDIGGTDFDDYQSMVHLLVYADVFDIEGIISSPYGDGRAIHILEAIDSYEEDYPNLKTYSDGYPEPDELRNVVKQGAVELPGPIGFDKPTEGSEWIIHCARREDSRPLNVLIWGGIDDLAQALHDAPDILPKLRVFFIGGPNKKWSVNAYQYIVENFPSLWIIESNATYRGWFVGGDQSGEWGNQKFVNIHVKDNGALGKYFYNYGSSMKMGDTPSLMRLLNDDPHDPAQPGWGGQYTHAWERPHKIFTRLTTLSDSLEEYGVLELRLPFSDTVSNPYALLNINNQSLKALIQNDTARFLFSPKNASKWNYRIDSNIPSLNNNEGQLTSYLTPATNKQNPSPSLPNWWVDDPSPEYAEGSFIGVKTVNKWRKDFLSDFAKRMGRCQKPFDKKNN